MVEKEHSEKKHFNLKRDFFYGLFLVLPVIATIWVVLFSIDLISGPVSSIFGKSIPNALSFIMTIIFITLIGVLARNLIGRVAIGYIEKLMSRIPIINIVYKSFKQVITAFSFQDKKLMSAVLVEYPRKGMWALGFLTREDPSGIYNLAGEDVVSDKIAIFIPTTPNPTSGYFLYVDKNDVIRLDITIEESIKILMSAGVLSPQSKPLISKKTT